MDRRQGVWIFDSPPWTGRQETSNAWLAPPKDYSPLGFSTSVPGNLADLEGATTTSAYAVVSVDTPLIEPPSWTSVNPDPTSHRPGLPHTGPPHEKSTPSQRLPLFFSRYSPVLNLPDWRKYGHRKSFGDPRFAMNHTTSLLSSWWRTSFYGSQSFWLFLYFSFNLLLTLSNKSVMTNFPFPYSLTAIHTMCSSFGGYFLRRQGFYISRRLSLRDELVLAAFSVLYSINIAVSNVSLHLVTVPVSFFSMLASPFGP